MSKHDDNYNELFSGQKVDATSKAGQFQYTGFLRHDNSLVYRSDKENEMTIAAREDFVVKDSGKREEYVSGMRRDTQEGKPNFNLLPRDFLRRWAIHMTKAVAKYGRDNWTLANSKEELQRFEDSALRHMMQWLDGDVEEDHAAAIAFNVAAAERVKSKLAKWGE